MAQHRWCTRGGCYATTVLQSSVPVPLPAIARCKCCEREHGGGRVHARLQARLLCHHRGRCCSSELGTCSLGSWLGSLEVRCRLPTHVQWTAPARLTRRDAACTAGNERGAGPNSVALGPRWRRARVARVRLRLRPCQETTVLRNSRRERGAAEVAFFLLSQGQFDK